MNKKFFALSWGRKMFFGLGWALTSLIALNYLQSMILPQSLSGWMYYLMTFIGHYGMMLTLVYFFAYCPLILIFPTYYISRLWSILLILTLNLGIFLDSYLFSRYHFHANSFLWDIYKQQKTLDVFGLNSFKLGLLGFVALILFVAFWMRGESLWRRMCARFSNPVKNWYLVLIFACFITSNLIHMFSFAEGGGPITRIANLFPLHFPVKAKSFLEQHEMINKGMTNKNQHYANMFYPANPLKCTATSPKNVLMIVVENWLVEWNKTEAPHLAHYTQHALSFDHHFSGGSDAQDGYFSLLYSLPPIYSASVLRDHVQPVFMGQLGKFKADVRFYKTEGESLVKNFMPEQIEGQLSEIEPFLLQRKEASATNPIFMQVLLQSGTLQEKDAQIKDLMNLFMRQDLMSQTIVILTGTHSENMATPLYVIWPGKRPAAFTKLSSHYDVLGTVMLEDWKCKNKMNDFSLGKNLLGKEESLQFVSGNYHHLVIRDATTKTLATIDDEKELHVEGSNTSDMKALLDALNRMTLFYRPR